MNRGDAAAAITEGTGKTREQAQAFLDILGSAFRRRGWVEGELDWAITDVPLPSGGFGIKYPTRVFERTGSRGAHIANSLALPGLTELVDEANNLRRAYEAKVAELAAETARHPVGGQADEGSLTTCPSCGEDHTDDGVCRPEGPSISQRRDGAWRHDRCDGYVIFRAGGWECGECGAGQQAEPSDGEMLLAARSFDGMAEDCDNNAADLGELTRPRWAGKAEGLRWAAEELRHRVEKARHVRAAAVSGEQA